MEVESGILKNVDQVLNRRVPGCTKQQMIVVTETYLHELYREELDHLIGQFEKSEIYYVEKSSYDQAVELAKHLCISDTKIVIGFGGGKVLDTAKYASFIAKAKYFCFPTTLSHDGIVSPIAVLNTEEDKRKSFGCEIPAGIIIDIDIVQKAPKLLLQSGIGDTLSNYTALYDWELAGDHDGNPIDDFAYMLSSMAFDTMFYSEEKQIKSKNFIRMLAQSLVISGLAMGIAGSSRPCSGSEHLFSHSLDENYKEINITHGMAVAMGSIASCILQKRDYHTLLDYLKDHEISIRPSNWGITEDIYVDAWLKAADTRKDRYTVLNEITLDPAELKKIYRLLEYDEEI